MKYLVKSSADYLDWVTSCCVEIQNSFGSIIDYGWPWWIRADLGNYYAWGRYGQKIMVSPEHKLVVAFTAGIPDGGFDPEFNLFRDYILPAIISTSSDMVPFTFGILAVSGLGIITLVVVINIRREKKI